jgi:hypothetical protein
MAVRNLPHYLVMEASTGYVFMCIRTYDRSGKNEPRPPPRRSGETLITDEFGQTVCSMRPLPLYPMFPAFAVWSKGRKLFEAVKVPRVCMQGLADGSGEQMGGAIP